MHFAGLLFFFITWFIEHIHFIFFLSLFVAQVVAIVSSKCRGYRVRYIRALAQHIAIDLFGACFQRPLPPHTNLTRFLQPYKFVIAFERKLCPDLATARLWQAFAAGVVPLVLGPTNVHARNLSCHFFFCSVFF